MGTAMWMLRCSIRVLGGVPLGNTDTDANSKTNIYAVKQGLPLGGNKLVTFLRVAMPPPSFHAFGL